MAPLTHFPHVFEPIDVGSMHLKNRVQFSPIVSNHCDVETGRVTREMLDFMSMQAQTGVGLVTIGSTPIDFEHGRDFYSCLSATNDLDIPGLSLLSDECHAYGTKLSAELIHAGQWAALNNIEAWVPSVLPEWHKQLNPDMGMFHEITRAEMDTVIEHYMACAKRCMDAGFDQVMVHIAHGNLLSGFLSTVWNQRGDAYGGSPEKRWKFPLECIEAVHSVTKGQIPIELRIVGDERIVGGTPIEERIDFLAEAKKYVDMLCVSTGTLLYESGNGMCYNMPGYYTEKGLNVKHAAAFKEAHPELVVSVVGGINTFEQAEEIISTGKADMVAMAKALMADDRFVVKGERGQEKDIVPCMRCMYCLRTVGGAHTRGCAMNPRMGWEYRWPRFIPAKKKKKIVIVGGGPSGMFSAKTLAERGHDVVLFEKENVLGGRFREASALWLKDGFRAALEYMRRTTMECGADVRLGTAATVENIKAENPDTIIIAVGGNEWCPRIPGVDGSNVVSVVSVDRGEVQTGQKVVVCGAGLSGSECAMGLGHEGKEVTVIDMQAEANLYKTLKDFTKPIFKARLAEAGVTMMYETGIKEINENGVVVTLKDGTEKLLEADTVVTAFGIRPDKAFIEELQSIVPETYVVGDANKVGQIGDATNSAYRACIQIDQ